MRLPNFAPLCLVSIALFYSTSPCSVSSRPTFDIWEDVFFSSPKISLVRSEYGLDNQVYFVYLNGSEVPTYVIKYYKKHNPQLIKKVISLQKHAIIPTPEIKYYDFDKKYIVFEYVPGHHPDIEKCDLAAIGHIISDIHKGNWPLDDVPEAFNLFSSIERYLAFSKGIANFSEIEKIYYLFSLLKR